MTIKFNKVVPEPFAGTAFNSTSIWDNDFSIESGQKVQLNASSGKGKTTFTHILAGIRNDYSGNVLFNDDSIKNYNHEEWSKIKSKQVSYVFQDLQIFPNLSVEENLKIKNDLTKFKTEKEIKNFVEQLELMDKYQTKMGVLSYGQQQRIAIIRALLQPFEWLILDEPFSHLDEDNTALCLNMINDEISQQGAGYILTTLGSNHGQNYDLTLKLQ